MVCPVIKIGDVLTCNTVYDEFEKFTSYWLVIDVIMNDSVINHKLLFLLSDEQCGYFEPCKGEYLFNYSDEFISFPENTWTIQ